MSNVLSKPKNQYLKPKNQYLSERQPNGSYKYWCFTCGKWISNKWLHQQIHDGIFYQCPRCPKRYTRNAALNDHIKTHYGHVFWCECGVGFKKRYLLRKHRRDVVHLLED